MAKNSTIRYLLLRLYSNNELETYLYHEMQHGWIIDHCRGNFFHFRRNTIKNARLCVATTECTKAISDNDDQVNEFIEIALRKGWQLLCVGDFESLVPMRRRLYFYTNDQEVAPLEGDAIIDFQNAHRAHCSTLKWTMLWTFFCIAALVTTIPFMLETGFQILLLLLNVSLLFSALSSAILFINRRQLYRHVAYDKPISSNNARLFIKLERVMLYALSFVGVCILLLLVA